MWTKTYSTVTKNVTNEQLWKLFADVNNWHQWDDEIEFAKLDGQFEKGNFFKLRPKGGPTVNIELVEMTENRSFTDLTRFPLAKMYGEHRFEKTSEGLRITTTMKVEGLLGFFWRKVVAQKIVDSLPVETEKQIAYASKNY